MMNELGTKQAARRFLRGIDLFNSEGRTGMLNVSKSQFYAKVVTDPDFPQAVSIGERAVAWYSDEVDAWVNNRQRTATAKAQRATEIRKAIAMADENHRLSKAVNADGTTRKPVGTAVINRTNPTVIGSGKPVMSGSDASRQQAAAPKSSNPSDFEPADAVFAGAARQGEIEHLEAHGVQVGVVNGMLSIQRRYVPTATSLIQQFRGGR